VFLPESRRLQVFHETFAFCGKPVAEARAGLVRCRLLMARPKKISCEDCYFRRNLLCALSLEEPCTTFRPDHPEGLRPPPQMRMVFRQERSTRAAWAFPSAQEQAALYAG
jgi:hypothetical protein